MRNMNWYLTVERYLTEGRSVSGSKGDALDKQQEQSQVNFNNTLQQAFSSQFGKQSDITNYLTGKLESQINNPTGLDDATKASMTSSAINNAATTYQSALKGVQSRMSTEGGPTALPNGVQSQIAGELAGQEANTESSGLEAIQQQDAQLKNTNLWNATSALGGNATTINPLGYGNAATSGSGAVSNLSSAFTQSNQSPLLGALGGIAGGIGSAFGGWLTKKL